MTAVRIQYPPKDGTRKSSGCVPIFSGTLRSGGIYTPALGMDFQLMHGSSTYSTHIPSCHQPPHREYIVSRVHSIPTRCRRCFVEFKDKDALTEHLYKSSENPCQSTGSRPERGGCNEDQAKALGLRSRQRMSDMEKWNHVWKILFPHDLNSDIVDPGKLFRAYS